MRFFTRGKGKDRKVIPLTPPKEPPLVIPRYPSRVIAQDTTLNILKKINQNEIRCSELEKKLGFHFSFKGTLGQYGTYANVQLGYLEEPIEGLEEKEGEARTPYIPGITWEKGKADRYVIDTDYPILGGSLTGASEEKFERQWIDELRNEIEKKIEEEGLKDKCAITDVHTQHFTYEFSKRGIVVNPDRNRHWWHKLAHVHLLCRDLSLDELPIVIEKLADIMLGKEEAKRRLLENRVKWKEKYGADRLFKSKQMVSLDGR